MEEKALLVAEFENNGRRYIYNPDLIGVEQAELAKEVLEFKYNSFQNPPKDFNQVLRSKSSDWLSMVMSYLLLEVKDGITQPFNRDLADKTEQFVKQLQLKNIAKLRECAFDFFTYIEMDSMYSELSSGEKKANVKEMLFSQLGQMMFNGMLTNTSNKEG